MGILFLLHYYPGLQQYLSSYSLICYNICLPFILEEKSISPARIMEKQCYLIIPNYLVLWYTKDNSQHTATSVLICKLWSR